MAGPRTKMVRHADNGPRLGRAEFDHAVKTSILETIQMIGDDYLDQFYYFLERKIGIKTLDSASLQEVEFALDSLFARFAIAIKHLIMFRVCMTLRLEPPRFLRSLEWSIQELRSSCW
jgi:hypothetical protein